jgi:hypothetical protein
MDKADFASGLLHCRATFLAKRMGCQVEERGNDQGSGEAVVQGRRQDE